MTKQCPHMFMPTAAVEYWRERGYVIVRKYDDCGLLLCSQWIKADKAKTPSLVQLVEQPQSYDETTNLTAADRGSNPRVGSKWKV